MPTDDQQDYAEDPVHDGESFKRPITLIPGIESDSYPLFPQPRTEGDSTRKKQIVKFCVFTVLLSFLVIGRAGVPENEPTCVVDRVHELLSGLHSSIVNSALLGSSLLIVFSVFMDFVFLATGWNWIFRGNSSRVIIATLLFYAIKLLMQPMWNVRAPVGYTWENPGFPSLVVSYGKATEFYYSGYIGLLVICACEWKKNGNAVMTRIIRLGAVAATIILLAYRANYFIDIFGGAYFAHYIFNRVDQYVEPLDKAVLRIHDSVKRFITCE